MRDLECWRCGAEGKDFALPIHPDGGSWICHTCYVRMATNLCPCCEGSREIWDDGWRPCWFCDGAGEYPPRVEREAVVAEWIEATTDTGGEGGGA